MKLRIASDFHVEFYHQYMSHANLNGRDLHECFLLERMEDESEQTLLLAGDVCTTKHLDRWRPVFDALSKRFKTILIIAGNHEHYGSIMSESFTKMREYYSQWDNIRVLENEVFVEDDVAIFGATMWTNFDSQCPIAMEYARFSMPDFRIIKKNEDFTYTPMDSVSQFHSTKVNIDEFFNHYNMYKKVIMTHHAPSEQSVAEKFKGSTLNPAFYTNLESLIIDNKPLLWVHGHMHNNSDYMIGDTRIVCNPYGYFGENPNEYNSKLVIDI